MITDFEPRPHSDGEAAPGLAGLKLEDKPDGPTIALAFAGLVGIAISIVAGQRLAKKVHIVQPG